MLKAHSDTLNTFKPHSEIQNMLKANSDTKKHIETTHSHVENHTLHTVQQIFQCGIH